MSATLHPFYIFEHPSFNDAHDAQRQSRLYGFKYRTDHTKYLALSERLKVRLSAEQLHDGITRPLEAIPDNSALYIVTLTAEGRETALPTLLEEALALGFSVLDDSQGRCHTTQGVWTIDGFQTSAK